MHKTSIYDIEWQFNKKRYKEYLAQPFGATSLLTTPSVEQGKLLSRGIASF